MKLKFDVLSLLLQFSNQQNETNNSLQVSSYCTKQAFPGTSFHNPRANYKEQVNCDTP